MAGFEYKARIQNVLNVLQDNNTSTSSTPLSLSLTSEILNENIVNKNPEIIPIHGRNLPAIFVRVGNSDEEFAGIGPTGPSKSRKIKNVIFEIIGIYPNTGAFRNQEDRLEDIYNMGRNIESVFQKEVTLSNTALWVNPRLTDYDGPFSLEDGTLTKTVMIELEGRFLFR